MIKGQMKQNRSKRATLRVCKYPNAITAAFDQANELFRRLALLTIAPKDFGFTPEEVTNVQLMAATVSNKRSTLQTSPQNAMNIILNVVDAYIKSNLNEPTIFYPFIDKLIDHLYTQEGSNDLIDIAEIKTIISAKVITNYTKKNEQYRQIEDMIGQLENEEVTVESIQRFHIAWAWAEEKKINVAAILLKNNQPTEIIKMCKDLTCIYNNVAGRDFENMRTSSDSTYWQKRRGLASIGRNIYNIVNSCTIYIYTLPGNVISKLPDIKEVWSEYFKDQVSKYIGIFGPVNDALRFPESSEGDSSERIVAKAFMNHSHELHDYALAIFINASAMARERGSANGKAVIVLLEVLTPIDIVHVYAELALYYCTSAESYLNNPELRGAQPQYYILTFGKILNEVCNEALDYLYSLPIASELPDIEAIKSQCNYSCSYPSTLLSEASLDEKSGLMQYIMNSNEIESLERDFAQQAKAKVRKQNHELAQADAKTRLREVRTKQVEIADVALVINKVAAVNVQKVVITTYCQLCNLVVNVSKAVTTKCISKCKYNFHLRCWNSIVYNNVAKCPSDWCGKYITSCTYDDITTTLEQPQEQVVEEVTYTLVQPPVNEEIPLPTPTKVVKEIKPSYRQEDVSEYELLSIDYKVKQSLKKDKERLRQQQKRARAAEKSKNKPATLPPPRAKSQLSKLSVPSTQQRAENTLSIDVHACDLPQLLQDLVNPHVPSIVKSVNVTVTIDDAPVNDRSPMILETTPVDKPKSNISIIPINTLPAIMSPITSTQSVVSKTKPIVKSVKPIFVPIYYYGACYECHYYPIAAVNIPCQHATHCCVCAPLIRMCPVCYGTIMSTIGAP